MRSGLSHPLQKGGDADVEIHNQMYFYSADNHFDDLHYDHRSILTAPDQG
jgi:hypothetical protein